MRKKIIAGNWKMNLSIGDGKKLAREIKEILSSRQNGVMPDVILCPPFPHLLTIVEIMKNSGIEVGAQDCSHKYSGAFTGEVSAGMIKSCGANWVIIGHSERRSYFNEDNELLISKARTAIDNGLAVIFCCGESLEQREESIHFSTIESQLSNGLFQLEKSDFLKCAIAYEPVWAIGTGLTATPYQAQEMHAFIRNLIKERYDTVVADKTTILYGGSCKPSNASDLFANEDVDGGLIGGASLIATDFASIISAIPV